MSGNDSIEAKRVTMFFKVSYFCSLVASISLFFFDGLPIEINRLTVLVGLFNEISEKSFNEQYVSDVFGLSTLFNILLLLLFVNKCFRGKYTGLTAHKLSDAMLYSVLIFMLLSFLYVFVISPALSLPSIAELRGSKGVFLRDTYLGAMLSLPVFNALFFLALATCASMTINLIKSILILIKDNYANK